MVSGINSTSFSLDTSAYPNSKYMVKVVATCSEGHIAEDTSGTFTIENHILTTQFTTTIITTTITTTSEPETSSESIEPESSSYSSQNKPEIGSFPNWKVIILVIFIFGRIRRKKH